MPNLMQMGVFFRGGSQVGLRFFTSAEPGAPDTASVIRVAREKYPYVTVTFLY
jgi:hypothetical protein